MKIRTKMIISNILILVIPSVIVLSLIAVFINGSGSKYWETMEKIYDDNNGVYSVQSLLNTYDKKRNIDEIKKEMSNAGYHFSIIEDDKVVFSDLTDDDKKQAEETLGPIYSEEATFSITKGKVSVIHERISEDGNKLDMMAIHTEAIPAAHGESYMQRYIALYVGMLLFITVLSVVIMNLLLSWWISRSILKPLKKLSEGSALIRDGYLDFKMTYNKKDELGMAISDFDEMRRHLKESVDERLRYEQYRKDLIVGISHDLRTPLTSIKGYVEGLRDGIAKSDEMKLKYYEAIETGIDSLEKLVSELTDFSRAANEKNSDSKDDFRTENVELNDFYENCIRDLNRKYVKDNIKISFEGLDEKAYADIKVKAMERINTNIVENAIKYRTAGESKVVFTLKAEGGEAMIRISDNGPGVADKDLGRIFECFYRADAARTAPGKGSGVGLAVVKQIAERHGGSVSAENDNGLAIIIRIPLSGGGEDEKNIDR